MTTITIIHRLLSNTVWMFFLIIGIWGTYRAIRGWEVDGSYIGSVAVGQVLFYVQGVLGILVWFAGTGRPMDGTMHWLYGAFSMVFLPFVYFYWLRSDDSNRAQWVLGFATLFMFGIALRSISTGA